MTAEFVIEIIIRIFNIFCFEKLLQKATHHFVFISKCKDHTIFCWVKRIWNGNIFRYCFEKYSLIRSVLLRSVLMLDFAFECLCFLPKDSTQGFSSHFLCYREWADRILNVGMKITAFYKTTERWKKFIERNTLILCLRLYQNENIFKISF